MTKIDIRATTNDAVAKFLAAGGKIQKVEPCGVPQHIRHKMNQQKRADRLAWMRELQPDHPVDCGPMPTEPCDRQFGYEAMTIGTIYKKDWLGYYTGFVPPEEQTASLALAAE